MRIIKTRESQNIKIVIPKFTINFKIIFKNAKLSLIESFHNLNGKNLTFHLLLNYMFN